MRRNAVLSAALLAAATFTVRNAHAQGYGVYEHDACVMGRSGTAVASPCPGGGAVFFNPAGIVGSNTRWNISGGLTLIAPRGQFTDSATRETTRAVANNIPVPNAFITRQINERWAVGLGVFAPYGLISEWPTTFEGRFLAYYAELKAIYIQPTLAYRFSDRVKLGVGLDIVHARAEVRQRIDLAEQVATTGPLGPITFGMLGIPAGTDFADAEIDVTGTTGLDPFTGNNRMGLNFGMIATPWDWISLGARAMTRVTLDLEGEAVFRPVPTGIVLPAGAPICNPPGSPPTCPPNTPLDAVVSSAFAGPLATQGARTTVPLPEQVVLGIALRPISGVMFLADYQYVNWKAFQVLPFDLDSAGSQTLREDYRSTSGWRGAVELTPSPRLSVRAGMLWHGAAAPPQTVTPLLPEGERVEGTAGVGMQLTPKLRLDLAYQYIRQQDRRGRVVEAPEGQAPTEGLNSGVYTSTAKLYGVSLVYGF
jgi:long-chain fatty acid transport protein